MLGCGRIYVHYDGSFNITDPILKDFVDNCAIRLIEDKHSTTTASKTTKTTIIPIRHEFQFRRR